MTTPGGHPQDEGRAPATSDKSTLEQNGVECLDCAETYEDQPVMECPEVPGNPEEGEPGHAINGVHIAEEPLGYEDDQEYWHPRLKKYVYPAAERWTDGL
jgi:hypothetical protein